MNELVRHAVLFILAAAGSVFAVACVPGEPGGGSGELCGGFAGLTCEDPGEFCDYALAAQCGAGDMAGVCTEIPTLCTREYAPVCGCDGKTYSNACMAHAAAVAIQALGSCGGGEPGEVCGGLAGAGCSDGEYCSYPPEAQCGAADQTGICTPKPEACTQHYDPVCGCDGKTYGNACSAASAGVSVVHDGEC